MTAETLLYILIAALMAFAITAYIYAYKSKLSNNLKWLLGIFRFLTLFTLFLLLINPKLQSVTYRLEKPKLPVVLDISASIGFISDTMEVKKAVGKIISNPSLQETFDVSLFSIGDSFESLDSIQFGDNQSRLEKVFGSLEEIYSGTLAPTIFLTDGNQTYGRDYEYSTSGFENRVYPVVLGDTTEYLDLKIAQLNTNRYSFLKNEFPIETVLVYDGENPITSRFTIRRDKVIVYSETVSFSSLENSKTISFTLPAKEVGLQRYTAYLEPVSEERNVQNNTKQFAVEIIDQATNILIVSDVVHPDLGTLKKAIETNEQRTVRIAKPIEATSILEDYQLVVMYQPNRSFNSVLLATEQMKSNLLWVTGSKTDWNYLNSAQGYFQKEMVQVSEEVGGQMNLNYGNYALEDIGFQDLPPLLTTFGELTISAPNDVLLNQEIDGILTGSPLLATLDLNGRKMGICDGENIWKWRSNSYLKNSDFQDFDEFIGKLIQYLASNKKRSRLEVTSETFYYNNSPVLISAQYFDKNFVFDNRAQIEIRTIHQETKVEKIVPLLLKNTYYEADLTSLPPGDYSFTVYVTSEGLSKSGNFTILDFNVEEQFLNANVTKLRRVATNTHGNIYTLNELDELLQTLASDETYKPVQKSQRKIVPLIDWKYLLALLVASLAAEWFIRKYNGLI